MAEQVSAPILEVEGLVVRYGTRTAVDGLSLAVRRGEIFGLLGPNGAGKTSTLSAIEGLLSPAAGGVKVVGRDAAAEPLAVRALIGVQLQASSFQAELTLTEILRLYAGLFDDDEAASLPLAPGRKAYVQVARGRVTANGEVLHQGDALMLEDEGLLSLSGGQEAEVLVFDLGPLGERDAARVI